MPLCLVLCLVRRLPELEKDLAEARKALDEAQADLEETKAKYGDDHEEVKSAQKDLDEANAIFAKGGAYVEKGYDVCSCLNALVLNLAALLTPAFVAFVADFLAFFFAFSLCCWCLPKNDKSVYPA